MQFQLQILKATSAAINTLHVLNTHTILQDPISSKRTHISLTHTSLTHISVTHMHPSHNWDQFRAQVCGYLGAHALIRTPHIFLPIQIMWLDAFLRYKCQVHVPGRHPSTPPSIYQVDVRGRHPTTPSLYTPLLGTFNSWLLSSAIQYWLFPAGTTLVCLV